MIQNHIDSKAIENGYLRNIEGDEETSVHASVLYENDIDTVVHDALLS